MKYSQYRFRFYVNASHEVFINGMWGDKHSHTWEIVVHIVKMQAKFVEFNKVEEKISDFLQQYEGGHFNAKKPFDTINPTLENCCEYFAEQISEILQKENWGLLMLEMSETPTRSCIINILDGHVDDGSKELDQAADTLIYEMLGESI